MTALRAAALVAAAEAGETFDEAATDAWVRVWRGLQGQFVGWAHLPASALGGVSEDELEQAWRELTDLLAARVAREPFFESMDDLLELSRRRGPDAALARRALARLRPGTKARFYAEFVDPGWVDLLADEGMFRHPPAAIHEGGFVRFPEWLEGVVLLRFAATAPESVARAASSVPASDNARVARLLAAIAAELPAGLAADHGLAARVGRDLGGNAELLDVGEPAAAFATRLAQAGRGRKARDILEALLRVDVVRTPSGVDFLPDWRHGRFRHDEYLVDETTRPLVAAMTAADAEATIKSLTRVLTRAQSQLAFGDSTQWRDDASDTRSPHGDDPRHLLFELLRDACSELASRNAEAADWVLDRLAAQESAIFARLRWHLLAQLPEQAARRRAVLSDPEALFSSDGVSEIYRLLPVGFAEMRPADRASLIELILTGPAPASYGLPAKEVAQLADEVEAWQDQWRQRLLSALEPLLDAENRARLDDLRRRRGRLEHPGSAGVRSSSWMGPSSPISAADLATMASDDVVALLRDFRAERHFATPTPEGLARELAVAVKSNPAHWTWVPERIAELAATYVRAWLSGLHAAIREDETLPDAPGVLGAIEWVLRQSGDPADQTPSRDGDVDFYGAQLTAADLLIESLAHDQIELADRELVWSLVARLASDSDPTPQRELATDAAPMQLAFSALRSRGAMAIVRYLPWLDARLPAGHGPGPLGFAAAPETQPVLERLLDEDPSRAVRAALAAELPVLASLDRDWLAARIDTVARPGADELAQAGWAAYLDYASVFDRAVMLLADAYRAAVATLATAPTEIDAERRELADHVAIIWRDLPDTAPNLLREHMATAPDADRARVIATLGRALHPGHDSGYEPTDTELARHRSLWDERLANDPGLLELREFGWWWTSGRLTEPADLRRLTRAVRLGAGRIGDIRPALILVDKLVAADVAFTEPALELLEVLVQERTVQSQRIDPGVLSRLAAAALADPGVHERAVALVHGLGEQGYVTLRSLLD